MPVPGLMYFLDEDGLWKAPGRPPLGTPVTETVHAGALPLGSTEYEPVGAARYVSTTGSDAGSGSMAEPWASLQYAINNTPSGGTIVVRGGVYEQGDLTSPNGKVLRIQNHPGETVWFDGSATYASWKDNGNGTWTTPYTVAFARFSTSGFPGDDPYRNHPDQVWINDAWQTQVADGTTPAVGQFSVDQNAQTLTVGSSPVGKTVRVGVRALFITASGRVDLLGVGFRRYCPQALEYSNGIVYYGGSSAGTVIEHCVFQDSGMAAVSITKPDFTVRYNTMEDLGYSGIAGTGVDRVRINRNLIRRYNRGRWQGTPSTGGMKVTRADLIDITQNIVRDPFRSCPSIWLDVSCTRFNVSNNVTVGGEGISVEEADGGKYSGVQYLSIVAGNDVYNGGIQVQCSGFTRYWNNRVTGYSVGFHITQNREKNNGVPAANRTQEECPWWTVGNEFVNNHFNAPDGSGYRLQLIAYAAVAQADRLLGADMFEKVAGNKFYPVPPGSMTQLGKADSYRNSYNTPAALAAAPAIVGAVAGKVGTNVQTSDTLTGSQIAATAVALDADIAAVLNLTAGDKVIGPNLAALPVER